MEALLPLDKEDLKDLGIKFYDRKIIFEETSKLHKVPTSSFKPQSRRLVERHAVAVDREQDDEDSEQQKKRTPMNLLGSEQHAPPQSIQGGNKPIFNIHTPNIHNIPEVEEEIEEARKILDSLTQLNKVLGKPQYFDQEQDALSNLDKTRSPKTDSTLLVTSSGPSAEIWGGRLGLYKKEGIHNNCPYYKQVDTGRSDGKEFVIYKRNEGLGHGWAMGPGLNGITYMENASKTESVPQTGWSCNFDDPHLKVSHDLPPACGEITITASGDAAAKQPSCVGVYTPTQRFSAGRQVFKHKAYELYLLVPLDVVTWSVQDSVEMKGGRMQSGCAPSLCPADPRARTSERVGYTSWIYGWYNGEARHGDITVKCSVHKY